jgi:hypothetical protein
VAPRHGLAALVGFQGEVSYLKNWLSTRADWIDAQFIAKPTFSLPAGLVAAGTQVEILIESTAAIYYTYTLDGTDPKGPTGAPSPSAQLYTGPITIDRKVRIISQSLESGAIWSGTTVAPSSNIAYDLLAHVGIARHIECRQLEEIRAGPARCGTRVAGNIRLD